MSETVEDRLKQAEQLLDEYDQKFLLNKIQVNLEVEDILNLKEEILHKFSREDCFSKAFILGQFSMCLQKEHNRELAKQKWASHNLNLTVGKEWGNYSEYIKYDIKVGIICQQNTYAFALNKIILESSIRIEELNYLATRVQTMADILNSFGKSKRD